jgi:hypothetical protein
LENGASVIAFTSLDISREEDIRWVAPRWVERWVEGCEER